jgi:Sec-independent protein secretion pathway component TatC
MRLRLPGTSSGTASMAAIRKYAFIVILILAAIITLSTDPFNMMIVTVPLSVLYKFGIVMARLFARTPVFPVPPPDAHAI